MKLLSLRWVFLLAALAGAGRCAYSGAAPARVVFAIACALIWLWLSRRKMRSLDRGTLGVPPRR